MGNGAKAAQKRERNAANGPKGASAEAKAKSAKDKAGIICQTCRQTFMITVNQKALEEHATNKHSKGLGDCFPGFTPAK